MTLAFPIARYRINYHFLRGCFGIMTAMQSELTEAARKLSISPV